MSTEHSPSVNYPELLVLTGDRQRAARLEQILREQAIRILTGARPSSDEVRVQEPDRRMK